MSKIAQIIKKRTDWSLTSEEVIQGITALENEPLQCFQIGAGHEYGLEPRSMAVTMIMTFNAQEVKNAYARIYQVDFPHEVRDFSEREMHELFHAVQEYVERRYLNNYTEEVIFIRPASNDIINPERG